MAYQTQRALRAPVLVVYNIVKFTVLDAFALAIIATGGPPAFPDIPGHESDVAAARRRAREIGRAMDELLKVVSNAGSYVSESDFFERSWQQFFCGIAAMINLAAPCRLEVFPNQLAVDLEHTIITVVR